MIHTITSRQVVEYVRALEGHRKPPAPDVVAYVISAIGIGGVIALFLLIVR